MDKLCTVIPGSAINMLVLVETKIWIKKNVLGTGETSTCAEN